MSDLPKTAAGRIEMIMSLYQQPVYDSDGNFVRYEETGLLTIEQVKELLNLHENL